MTVGIAPRALAIAAFGLTAAYAAPAVADTASEIRALKARLNKLEAQEAEAKRAAKVAAQQKTTPDHGYQTEQCQDDFSKPTAEFPAPCHTLILYKMQAEPATQHLVFFTGIIIQFDIKLQSLVGKNDQ
jgi:hypothetical protein